MAYAYGLAETGTRAWHGNLFWSAQIGIFCLFLSSTAFMWKRIYQASSEGALWPRPPYRLVVCSLVYALHLASGIIFAYTQGQADYRAWW